MFRMLASILQRFNGILDGIRAVEEDIHEMQAEQKRQAAILKEIRDSVAPPAGGVLKSLQIFYSSPL